MLFEMYSFAVGISVSEDVSVSFKPSMMLQDLEFGGWNLPSIILQSVGSTVYQSQMCIITGMYSYESIYLTPSHLSAN